VGGDFSGMSKLQHAAATPILFLHPYQSHNNRSIMMFVIFNLLRLSRLQLMQFTASLIIISSLGTIGLSGYVLFSLSVRTELQL
jgi:hypothetical protein